MKEHNENFESSIELHSSPDANEPLFASINSSRIFKKEREPLAFPLWGECLSEILGTMIMIAFGTGVVAQEILTTGSTEGAHSAPNYLAIRLGWGLGVAFGVIASTRISGAHLNPAVSLALLSIGRFSWRKLPFYALSQLFGAFLGAGFTYCCYSRNLDAYDGGRRTVFGPNATHGIFVTNPSDAMNAGSAFVVEMMATFLLLTIIISITWANEAPQCVTKKEKSTSFQDAVLVGLLVAAIGMCFGADTGAALNPARDLGPRLFLAVAGWGADVFRIYSFYFWVPIVAPLVGAVIGAQMVNGLQRIPASSKSGYFS